MKKYIYAVLVYSNEPAGIINGTQDYIIKTVHKLNQTTGINGVLMCKTYEEAEKECKRLNKEYASCLFIK